MVNLITEFRPDLYWRLLRGSIRLVMDRRFLDTSLARDSATVFPAALVLLAKPSASPAAAGLLAVAATAALACRWRENMVARGSGRELLRSFVRFAGLMVILVVPYFALDASPLYTLSRRL